MGFGSIGLDLVQVWIGRGRVCVHQSDAVTKKRSSLILSEDFGLKVNHNVTTVVMILAADVWQMKSFGLVVAIVVGRRGAKVDGLFVALFSVGIKVDGERVDVLVGRLTMHFLERDMLAGTARQKLNVLGLDWMR